MTQPRACDLPVGTKVRYGSMTLTRQRASDMIGGSPWISEHGSEWWDYEVDDALRHGGEIVGDGATRVAADIDRNVSIPQLLAAYSAEQDGSIEALTYAQHIVERLVAEDVFGQLARLRHDLAYGLGVPPGRAIDHVLFELDAILGEA